MGSLGQVGTIGFSRSQVSDGRQTPFFPEKTGVPKKSFSGACLVSDIRV